MSIYRDFLKRIFDFTIALFGLLVLLPLFLIIYLIILFLTMNNPLFFQPRPGKDEKIFKIIKFKTMTDEKDSNGNLLPDIERLTKIGKFLRSTSLDELPQLINVLNGDMSLIGPRPLLTKYLPYYTMQEKLRHTVRPGLTGLSQVNGRNKLNWERKFAYDIEYVYCVNFITDLQIIFKTILKVFNQENIGTRGVDVPEDFDKYRSRQNEFKKEEHSL